jgi:hypothetical protein
MHCNTDGCGRSPLRAFGPPEVRKNNSNRETTIADMVHWVTDNFMILKWFDGANEWEQYKVDWMSQIDPQHSTVELPDYQLGRAIRGLVKTQKHKW